MFEHPIGQPSPYPKPQRGYTSIPAKEITPGECPDSEVLRQNPELRERPGFMDYERVLGASDLNPKNFDDFVRMTEPDFDPSSQNQENIAPGMASGACQRPGPSSPEQNPQNVAPSGLGQHPIFKKPKATKQEMHKRLMHVQAMLIHGCSTWYIAEACKGQYGIGRRMTQLYIKRVRKMWANQAANTDYLAHLQHARLQREHLYFKIMQKIDDPMKISEFTGLLRMADRFLKERDNAMREIKEHRESSQRDNSPDGEKAKAGRARVFIMEENEWFHRIANLRNHFRWEWEQEKSAAYYDKLARWQAGLNPENVAPGDSRNFSEVTGDRIDDGTGVDCVPDEANPDDG